MVFHFSTIRIAISRKLSISKEVKENGILTCILSCKNQIASLCLTQDAACLGLVHGDDPERCYEEGGGRGVHVWERM